MRRLSIGWAGTSHALIALKQALEAYGHVCATQPFDLFIEDGTQVPLTHCVASQWLSLRLGIGPECESGLPALQVRGYDRDQRVLAVHNVAEEPSGNGQRLRRQATNSLVEWAATLSAGSQGTQIFLPPAAPLTPGLNTVCMGWTPWRLRIGSIAPTSQHCCRLPRCQ